MAHEALELKEDFAEACQRLEMFWQVGTTDRACLGLSVLRNDANLPPIPEPSCFDQQVFDIDFRMAHVEAALGHWHYCAEAMPIARPEVIPMLLPMQLGCNVVRDGGTIWIKPTAQNDWGDMPEAKFDPHEPFWRATMDFAAASLECGAGRWITGNVTDGLFDVLAAARGNEALLLDMVDRPEEVASYLEHLLSVWESALKTQMAPLIKRQNGCVPWFGVFAPGKTAVALQNDFSAMISPQLFEDLCLCEVENQCKQADYAAYHLDGPDAIRHLDALLSIEELNAIEWVAGPQGKGMKQWVPMLRRVQDAGKAVIVRSTWLVDGDAEYILNQLRPEGLFLGIFCHDTREAEDWIRVAEHAARNHRRHPTTATAGEEARAL